MIGRILSHYEITAKVGEGGMGEVYRARDSKLRRDVAIKVLPPAFTEDRERLSRFEREAQLLAQLQHPNVASIYGLEEADGVQALVMELVEGPTLDERLSTGPLPIDECLTVSLQIAEALEEAHEKGIIHRDLKPQNVKAPHEGTVKVLDFGLAKAMDPVAGQTVGSASQLANSPTLTLGATVQGMILGTAAYMAPEQAKGLVVDKRADIWSFGVVLYEMLTGRRLFEASTVQETLAQVLTRDPDLANLPSTTPAAIRRLLRRCLARSPKHRLHDIADARIVIREVLSGSLDDPPPSELSSEPTRGSRVAWTVAAMALLVAAVLGVLLWRQTPPPSQSLRYQRLTYQPQFISNARFAPDGTTVVFSAALEGSRPELFVRRPEDPQPRRLIEGAVQLQAISSRGELAVLVGARLLTHRSYVGTLARMPLASASPREILEGVTAADWSPDGAELAVIRQNGDRSQLEYPIGNVLAESAGYLSDLRVSPAGDRLAFMPHALATDDRGPVVIIDLEGVEIARSPEYWGAEGLAWRPDGKGVVYSSSDAGSRQEIRELSVDGTTRDLLAGSGTWILHDQADDGRLLSSTDEVRTVVVARFPGETSEREVLLFGRSDGAVLSVDGRSLLFSDASELSGRDYAAYLQRADRSPPVRLGEGWVLDLSPDASTALTSVPSEPPRLMLYPTGPGDPREISIAGFSAYESGAFFPDGKRVLLCGAEVGKSRRCYVRDLETDRVRAVTPEGTDRGHLFPDGQAVLARRPGGDWARFPLDGGAASEVAPLEPDEKVIRVRRDGRSLLVFGSTAIESLDLASGDRSVIREFGPPAQPGVKGLSYVAVSADESAYAYTFKRSLSTLFSIEGAR